MPDVNQLGLCTWLTRDGRRLQWKNMRLHHLQNAANFVVRSTSEKLNSAYRASGFVQGEMASYEIERAIQELEEQLTEAKELKALMLCYATFRATGGIPAEIAARGLNQC